MRTPEHAVQSTIERMTASLARGDLGQVMTTYEPSATIMFEPGTPISNPEAQRERFAAMLALEPRFNFGHHEIFVAGDIALHLMPWAMEGKAPDGSAVEQGGLSVAVLRRQPDGEWLMVIDDPHGQRLLDVARGDAR